jgi:tetratricopeptide (TPR) repeat protein
MESNLFAPKLTQHETVSESVVESRVVNSDTTSRSLLAIAQIALIGLAFLLPIFFLPGLAAGLGFSKVLLGFAAVGVLVIALSLLMLRLSSVRTVVPVSLLLLWGVVISAFVSGLFSADSLAAFRGSVIETQTVAFLALMAVVASIGLLAQQNKHFMMRILQVLLGSATLLLLYVSVRLLFGPLFGFGSFSAVTTSPIGNFNDTAVFAALLVLLSTISLLQLQLSKVLQIMFAVIVMLSLFVLAVVNFSYVWLVVGFFGLLVLLYIVAQDTLFASGTDAKITNVTSKIAVGVVLLVCLTSASFVVAGEYIGGYVSNILEVEYLEVRPSFEATIAIAQGVYADAALFGVGPNQFDTSWREHKDVSINQTLFWNTDFQSGSGYVPTLFVTLGLVGGLLLLLFHTWYLWSGARMLLKPETQDSQWYYLGVITFTGAVFLWGMSYVYVPSATILLLAALFTGLSLATSFMLQPTRVRTIPLVLNRQRGFVLMAIAIVCITGTMGTWFTIGKQYVAQADFNQTQSVVADIATVDQAALAAYQLYPDHRFLGVRARIALLEMNQVLTIQEPTEADQQRFLEISDRALSLADTAVRAAPREPSYHAILAGVYNNLALAGIPGALDRSTTSIATAVTLDPKNPTYALLTAQLAANRGDIESVRAALTTALAQKRNYTEALFALAQLDIAEGDAEGAIATTQAIITLEPNNPARYYQLGILLSSNGNSQGAVVAYEAALTLDPNFANARYLLAVLQAQSGSIDEAIDNLELVLQSNTENEQLQTLIETLRSGESIELPDTVDVSVNESEPVNTEETVTSTIAPDSDLLTPLNTVSEQEIRVISDESIEELSVEQQQDTQEEQQ